MASMQELVEFGWNDHLLHMSASNLSCTLLTFNAFPSLPSSEESASCISEHHVSESA